MSFSPTTCGSSSTAKISQVAQDVSMTIDHPWHDQGVGQIDHADARGCFTADALNPMVLDQDKNIFRDLSGLNVE